MSALEKNLSAAAISNSPTMTFTSLSHAPARGSDAVQCGASARRRNGSANTVENTAMPARGVVHSPLEADTSNGPTNGAVHVNEASVSATPIIIDPSG